MSKQKSYWISSGKFSLIERVSILSFGILSFYLLVRILPKQDYGTWILYITIINFIDTSRHGFFKNPLIRFLSLKENENNKQLANTSFFLNLATSSLVTLLMLLLSVPLGNTWSSPELVSLFYIHLATNIFLTFFYHLEYLQKANLYFKGSAVGYATKGLIFSGLLLFAFLSKLELTLMEVGLMYSLSILVAALTSFFFSRSVVKLGLQYDTQWVKKLFSYGKYTLGTNISAVLLRYIDTWMVGYFISPIAVATYNVATRIANLFEVPSMTLASIMFPKAVRNTQADGHEAFKNLYEKSVSVILLMTVPFVVFVLIFADYIIYFLAGEDYMDSVDILRVTVLYGLLVPFNKQMGVLLDAIGKAKLNTLFVARNALLNLILNAIAIPIYGTIGAAYATLSTFFIVLIINQFYLSKTFKVELGGIFRNMLFYSGKILKMAQSKF